MLLKVLDIHNTAHMLCIVHKSQLNKKKPQLNIRGKLTIMECKINKTKT